MTEGPENGGGEGTRSNDPDRGPATWRDKATVRNHRLTI